MANEIENTIDETLCDDRALFSSLLKYVVQAAPNEDASDFVLASIGQNVGADRCYVYRFWDPEKTSMCTNTHEWCAEGIAPEIGGQQTCDLSILVEFNAHIKSGRDFLFTDISKIDAGSREWLEPQGIKSLIATPLVGANGQICGFAGFDFVRTQRKEFTERIIVNIHEAADLLVNCQRLHERDVALMDVTQRENEREESDSDLQRTLVALQKDVRTMHPKQMLDIVRNRLEADICYIVQDFRPEGGGAVLPEHALARGGWANARSWVIDQELGRAFDTRLRASAIVTFHEEELGWLRSNISMEEVPPYFLPRLKVLHAIGIRHEGRLLGALCVGYLEERPFTALHVGFLRNAGLVIVSALERIATYRDLTVALNIVHLKAEVVEFMFKHQRFEEVRDFIGRKVCDITGAQHLMLCLDDGTKSDWFGADAPQCCHDCVKKSVDFRKDLPADFFPNDEMVIVRAGQPLPDMNLPPYCPMRSSAVSQIRRGDGWWRMVADYTKAHKHNMDEVARGMRVALEFLAIAYDREQHEKTIARMQAHQRYRADMLRYALSCDDLPGLIDMLLHRLLELTACDYIAIHSLEGDHRLLYPGKELEKCPARCEECTFYKLKIPPVEDADHIIELVDAQGQTTAPLSPICPAKSLEVVVVYCEGKPWGGIALHYIQKQHKIAEDDRNTLKIAADVLTLALERHAAATRLKAERDRVVEAEKSRSYFFSAVSHDISTPLNAIIGFSELLDAGGVAADVAKQYLKVIMSSGKTLMHLVSDVIDISKMDLGKLEFSFEPTDVGEIVREAEPVFLPMTSEKKQSIVLDIPEMPCLLVDSHRFRQVLFNFVSNAVKYAGPCTIRVSVAYEDGLLKLKVSDNGKGVSSEKAKHLMQPFVQADIKNRKEGSGLGLAICKQLVEIAHGTISIETAPGKGFTIHVEVPVAVAPDGAKGEKKDALSTLKASDLPKRILVVDDSPVNRMVLKAMLEKLGVADVELAEDGVEALERLEKDPSFDLVMADMWMPVMDGTELVKRIRADERLSRLKVCSITADVEARATYKEQGFDLLLLKPATMEKMAEMFMKARW